MLEFLKKILPRRLVRPLLPGYHFMLAMFGALLYRFPSRELTVVAVTGTKGKSTVVEMLGAMCTAAGKRVALSSTIRFQIADHTEPNRYKMTMPGRFFLSRFLRQAVSARCDIAIIEMTSEAAVQSRHRFLALDALIFTNIAPEHIESHGSFENYLVAKLSIARQLERSPKRPRAIIANAADAHADAFLTSHVEQSIPYRIDDADAVRVDARRALFEWDETRINLMLGGHFNVENALAALSAARFLGIDTKTAAAGLAALARVPGRNEYIDAGQPFGVVVDYAHTPDSLRALYRAHDGAARVCVLGNTGGGRDTWKRPEMARIADEHCAHIILTNEDPYDEDPRAIIDEMADGLTIHKPDIIIDRREAIRAAIQRARTLHNADADEVVVLITGKGTDPYIMEAGGVRTPWSDARVAREELAALGFQ